MAEILALSRIDWLLKKIRKKINYYSLICFAALLFHAGHLSLLWWLNAVY
jgi:hypothetical protein